MRLEGEFGEGAEESFNAALSRKNRWKTLPMPKMYPEWEWPVDGGVLENTAPFFDAEGSLLTPAEVTRTIEEVCAPLYARGSSCFHPPRVRLLSSPLCHCVVRRRTIYITFGGS